MRSDKNLIFFPPPSPPSASSVQATKVHWLGLGAFLCSPLYGESIAVYVSDLRKEQK